MIAILIPVKNAIETIERCLMSVENQTFFKSQKNHYSIYLVNNNSTDETIEQTKKFKNIIHLECHENGIVPTLNTGLFEIMNDKTIKYIARLDADDEWEVKKIEKQMQFLLSNEEYDICGTQIKMIKKNKNTTLPFQNSFYPTEDSEIKTWLYSKRNPLCHPSVIFNKRIFYKLGGYDENYRYAEDLDLWLRASRYFKFYNINDFLMNYTYDNRNNDYNQKQYNNSALAYNRTINIINNLNHI